MASFGVIIITRLFFRKFFVFLVDPFPFPCPRLLYSTPFALCIDASDTAVLRQFQSSQETVISYWSCQNYSTIECEVLAAVGAVKEFMVYSSN